MSNLYIALRDNPGPCPGPDWQLFSCGPIHHFEIDRERYVITPIMRNGSRGAPLEFRELFEQFLMDTADPHARPLQ